MKTYNSSDLNNKRSEILEEAAKNGVVIQEKKTNGEVRRGFLICLHDPINLEDDDRVHVKDSDVTYVVN